ncbi:MAG: hybrid sensor histidine kinase/response regulator, partial [Novosphingobium sp.]
MSAPGSRLVPSGSERLVVGAALAVSLALVWLATGELLLLAAFAAGLIALGGLTWVLARPKPVESQVEYALPDWSVTVAAIDRPDCAVAITDRAGRLVCANRAFEAWFTTAHA